MLDVITSQGTDRCLGCDTPATVSANVALDGQFCRTCLSAIPQRLTTIPAQAGADSARCLGWSGAPLAGMVASARARGDEAVLWALGRHLGWMDELPIPDGIVAIPAGPWRRVLRGVSPHDVVACSLAAFLGLPLLAPLDVRRAHDKGAPGRECVRLQGPATGTVLLVGDVLPRGERLTAYVDALRAAGADEVHLLGVAARGPTDEAPARLSAAEVAPVRFPRAHLRPAARPRAHGTPPAVRA